MDEWTAILLDGHHVVEVLLIGSLHLAPGVPGDLLRVRLKIFAFFVGPLDSGVHLSDGGCSDSNLSIGDGVVHLGRVAGDGLVRVVVFANATVNGGSSELDVC